MLSEKIYNLDEPKLATQRVEQQRVLGTRPNLVESCSVKEKPYHELPVLTWPISSKLVSLHKP